tara:strand:- start:2909 stop:3280 length:372 start_codon:yes stop_codon:yes gene_type:complete
MENIIKYGKEDKSLNRHRVKPINEYGLHTPSFTQQTTNTLLAKTGIKFMDNSYGNDCMDSLWDEKNGKIIMTIYLPNTSVEKSKDEIQDYYFIEDYYSDVIYETKKLSELIAYINKNKSTLYK